MMKKQSLLIGGILIAIVGMVWLIFGNQASVSQPDFKSEAEARSFLKDQVAEGTISELEARVRLAEALVQVKKQERRQDWWKEYQEDIRQLMEEKGVSEDEAKALLKRSMKGSKKSKTSKGGVGKSARVKDAGEIRK